MAKLREIVIKSPDPVASAEIFRRVFELDHVYDAPDGTVLLTDGYLLVAFTKPKGDADNSVVAELDHLGFYVDDMDDTLKRVAEEDMTEYKANSNPYSRRFTTPGFCDLEFRLRGWDESIQAVTQLFRVAPVEEQSPTIQLGEVSPDSAGYVAVASVHDLPPGRGARVEVAGQAIFVLNLDGEFKAVQDTCPHLPVGRLSSGPREGSIVECPVHGSRFDVATCAVLERPARRDLVGYETKVVGDEVFVKATN